MSGRGNAADLDAAEALVRAHPGRTARELAWILMGGQVGDSGALVGVVGEVGAVTWEKSRSLHKRLADLCKPGVQRVVKRGGRHFVAGEAAEARRPAARAEPAVSRSAGRAAFAALRRGLG